MNEAYSKDPCGDGFSRDQAGLVIAVIAVDEVWNGQSMGSRRLCNSLYRAANCDLQYLSNISAAYSTANRLITDQPVRALDANSDHKKNHCRVSRLSKPASNT